MVGAVLFYTVEEIAMQESFPTSPAAPDHVPSHTALDRMRQHQAQLHVRNRMHQAEKSPEEKYAPITVIAVGARSALLNFYEWRVGVVKASDYEEGLRLESGALNPRVAARCFGESPRFTEESEAEAYALEIYKERYEILYNHHLSLLKPLPPDAPAGAENERNRLCLAHASAGKQLGGVKILHLPSEWPSLNI